MLFLCEHGAHRSAGCLVLVLVCSGHSVHTAANLVEEVRWVADCSCYTGSYSSTRSRIHRFLGELGIVPNPSTEPLPTPKSIKDITIPEHMLGRPRGEADVATRGVASGSASGAASASGGVHEETRTARPRGEAGDAKTEAGDAKTETGSDDEASSDPGRPCGEAGGDGSVDYGRSTNPADDDDGAVNPPATEEELDAARARFTAQVTLMEGELKRLHGERDELQADIDGLHQDMDQVEMDVTLLKRKREQLQGTNRPTIAVVCEVIRRGEWEDRVSRALALPELPGGAQGGSTGEAGIFMFRVAKNTRPSGCPVEYPSKDLLVASKSFGGFLRKHILEARGPNNILDTVRERDAFLRWVVRNPLNDLLATSKSFEEYSTGHFGCLVFSGTRGYLRARMLLTCLLSALMRSDRSCWGLGFPTP